MIIIIDDERTFEFDVDIRETLYCRSSNEGIHALIITNKIDELWLDHDLGEDDNAMKVVDFLCEKAFNGEPIKIGRIFVHTQNPVGGKVMLNTLDHYGYDVIRCGLPAMRKV